MKDSAVPFSAPPPAPSRAAQKHQEQVPAAPTSIPVSEAPASDSTNVNGNVNNTEIEGV